MAVDKKDEEAFKVMCTKMSNFNFSQGRCGEGDDDDDDDDNDVAPAA